MCSLFYIYLKIILSSKYEFFNNHQAEKIDSYTNGMTAKTK